MKKRSTHHFLRNVERYLLLLGTLGITLYLWNAKGDLRERQAILLAAQANTDRPYAQEMLDSITKDQLLMVVQAFSWAVRAEMINGNNKQLDGYFRQFVKATLVLEVCLLDQDGRVQVSTNKKQEGDILSNDWLAEALVATDIFVIEGTKTENLVVVAPVISQNQHLGTLVVFYQRPVIQYPIKTNHNPIIGAFPIEVAAPF